MPFDSPTASVCLAVVVVSVALLVTSDHRRWRAGIWLCKPLASLAFVAFAVALGVDLASDRWLLAALCACALGDVLLIPEDERAFQAGVASFGLGHALYAVAFALRGVHLASAAVSAVVLALLAVRVYRWLAPGVPAPLKPAVAGYCAVITAMVAVAAGTTVATGDARVAAGAVMFFVSDLSVARDKFVAPGFVNRAWGLPLYYAAQLVLAATIAQP
jgi:uncharacterized membrane protein YhhN